LRKRTKELSIICVNVVVNEKRGDKSSVYTIKSRGLKTEPGRNTTRGDVNNEQLFFFVL